MNHQVKNNTYIVEKGPVRSENGCVAMTHPSWVLGNARLKILKPFIKQYMHGRLVDIGCGTKPYQALLAPYITEHIGVDHNEMFHDCSNVDIFADAYNIPVPDGSFDCALSTDVLEHLEEPQKAFNEVSRILRGGGTLLLTVPFLYHLHEQPRDFYRYTRFGLEYLAGQAGLEMVEMKPVGGLCTFVMQEIAYMIYFAARLKIIRPLQILLMNVFLIPGWLLNWIDPTKSRLPAAYICVFRKPAP